MKYQSERLIFHEFKEEDFGRFYSVFSNEQVMNYAFMDHCSCEEEILPYFKEVIENNNTVINRKAYEFAVCLASDGSFIGFGDIRIHFSNPYGGCGEIGYFILPDYWGKGYATEIASSLIGISFKYLNLHRIDANCNADNARSEGVMKKAGMLKEGEFRKARYKHGQWVNEKHYSILLEDWEDSKTLKEI